MAGVQWYVTLEGVEQGPLNPAQMKGLVQSGAIGPDTPIRRDGMDRTVPASQVKGLLPVAAAGATTPAPSQLAAAPTSQPATQPVQQQSARSSTRRSTTRRGARSRPAATPEPAPEPPQAEDDIEEAYDDDGAGDDVIDRRATVGQRIGAHLLDGAFAGILLTIILATGFGFSAVVLGGTMGSINESRAKKSANRSYEQRMPTFEEWRDELSMELPPAIPEEIKRGEEETDREWWEREQPYLKEKAAAENAQNLYEWRKNVYENDLPAVERAEGTAGLLILLASIGGFVAMFLYMPFLEGARGRTFGKQILGLAVVKEDYRSCGLGGGFFRMVCRIIPLYFITAFSSSRLALHDSITGTQVVRQEFAKLPGKKKRGKSAPGATGRRRAAQQPDEDAGESSGSKRRSRGGGGGGTGRRSRSRRRA